MGENVFLDYLGEIVGGRDGFRARKGKNGPFLVKIRLGNSYHFPYWPT